MDDSDLFADVQEHDGRTWHNDVFELFFKPANDKSGYYEFQVNADGTGLNIFIPQRQPDGYERFRSDGDFHLESKVVLDGTLNKRYDIDVGWSVEGRIPWRVFIRTGGRPVVGEVWRFALCRYDYSVASQEPELSTCAPLKVASFHQHEDYAKLRFIGPAENSASRRAKLQPYVPTSRVVGLTRSTSPYRVRRVLPNSHCMSRNGHEAAERLQVAARNLGLIMRKLFQIGTPRGLQRGGEAFSSALSYPYSAYNAAGDVKPVQNWS